MMAVMVSHDSGDIPSHGWVLAADNRVMNVADSTMSSCFLLRLRPARSLRTTLLSVRIGACATRHEARTPTPSRLARVEQRERWALRADHLCRS